MAGGLLARHPCQDLRIRSGVPWAEAGGRGGPAVGVDELVDVPGQLVRTTAAVPDAVAPPVLLREERQETRGRPDPEPARLEDQGGEGVVGAQVQGAYVWYFQVSVFPLRVR